MSNNNHDTSGGGGFRRYNIPFSQYQQHFPTQSINNGYSQQPQQQPLQLSQQQINHQPTQQVPVQSSPQLQPIQPRLQQPLQLSQQQINHQPIQQAPIQSSPQPNYHHYHQHNNSPSQYSYNENPALTSSSPTPNPSPPLLKHQPSRNNSNSNSSLLISTTFVQPCKIEGCLLCLNGAPEILQTNTWANIMRVVFFVLMADKREQLNKHHHTLSHADQNLFLSLKYDIYDFMNSHWGQLTSTKNQQENWKKQIQDILSHSKDLFESGQDLLSQNGYWRLKKLESPWEVKIKKSTQSNIGQSNNQNHHHQQQQQQQIQPQQQYYQQQQQYYQQQQIQQQYKLNYQQRSNANPIPQQIQYPNYYQPIRQNPQSLPPPPQPSQINYHSYPVQHPQQQQQQIQQHHQQQLYPFVSHHGSFPPPPTQSIPLFTDVYQQQPTYYQQPIVYQESSNLLPIGVGYKHPKSIIESHRPYERSVTPPTSTIATTRSNKKKAPPPRIQLPQQGENSPWSSPSSLPTTPLRSPLIESNNYQNNNNNNNNKNIGKLVNQFLRYSPKQYSNSSPPLQQPITNHSSPSQLSPSNISLTHISPSSNININCPFIDTNNDKVEEENHHENQEEEEDNDE